MSTLEGRMRTALQAGQTAARDRRPRSTNPHRYDADTARERVLARMWAAGWDDACTIPVLDDDYDGPD